MITRDTVMSGYHNTPRLDERLAIVEASLVATEKRLANIEANIQAMRIMTGVTVKNLDALLGAKVVSMKEYISLNETLKELKVKAKSVVEKQKEQIRFRNEILAEIPRLKQEIASIKAKQEASIPTGKVLKFKKDDQ